jgi:hypothetical protein
MTTIQFYILDILLLSTILVRIVALLFKLQSQEETGQLSDIFAVMTFMITSFFIGTILISEFLKLG